MASNPVQSKHIISIHQPYLWLVSGLVIFLLISLLIWSAFQYGLHEAGFDLDDYDQQIEILQISLAEETLKKEEALRDNARLSRGSDIQKDASGKINETLAICEDEGVKMKEELTFYHNVVAPRKSKREIQVNKVLITAKENGTFQYKIVLIQVGKHDYLQRGYVELTFKGINEKGQEIRLDLPTVALKKTTKRQKFGFKYFQNFEGGIRFPQGFEPQSLFIKAHPKSARVPGVEKSYPWGSLITRGSESNVGQEKI